MSARNRTGTENSWELVLAKQRTRCPLASEPLDVRSQRENTLTGHKAKFSGQITKQNERNQTEKSKTMNSHQVTKRCFSKKLVSQMFSSASLN